jgi:glycosyltransferase involved in cell wall biosynthesis
VDDGSTDPRTLRVFEDLERKGYVVIHQRNQGVSAARNVGIRSAGGEYILPVDSDNRIREPYLKKATLLFDADPSLGVVYGDVECFGDRSERRAVPDFSFARLVMGNYIDTCAIFRKSLWDEVGGYDENMPFYGWEDWDFWLRSALRGWRFTHLCEVAFDYRVTADSLLAQADTHDKELFAYIFGKRELFALQNLRSELSRLLGIESSREYWLGKRLLAPLRQAHAAARSFRR